jgi:hypothetical protein
MGTPEYQLKASLIALLDGIKRSDGPIVTQEMERLDNYLLTSRGELHPQLAHFLERRSYAKALAYLEAESAV